MCWEDVQTYLEHVWSCLNMFKKCMEHAWMCVEHFWIMLEACLDLLRHVLEMLLTLDMFETRHLAVKICVRHAQGMSRYVETSLIHVWYIF